MKKRPSDPCPFRHRTFWAIAVLVYLMAAGQVAAAEIQTATPAPADPIHIKADKLVIDQTTNSAVFSGNARAVQGQTVVTADQLTIVSSRNTGTQPSAKPSIDMQGIERIEADGHVRIEFDNRIAVSQKAVYHTAQRKLVLSGTGTKVTSGHDEVSGNMITFFREDGRIECAGDDRNQVKATIHGTERGLN